MVCGCDWIEGTTDRVLIGVRLVLHDRFLDHQGWNICVLGRGEVGQIRAQHNPSECRVRWERSTGRSLLRLVDICAGFNRWYLRETESASQDLGLADTVTK